MSALPLPLAQPSDAALLEATPTSSPASDRRALVVRVGIPKDTGAIPGMLERAACPEDVDFPPALLSASTLWRKATDKRPGYFKAPSSAIDNLDCALDSAGFVVMSLWGGSYPWTVEQYVELAWRYSWAWWSQMDFCCEPKIAASREEVRFRVWMTGWLLHVCRSQAAWWRHQIREMDEASGVYAQRVARHPRYYELTYPDPMPVLQGWLAEDYAESAEMADGLLYEGWPDLVGVGSVCGRHLGGPDGLWAILGRLDRELPRHVRLHLFGVKGAALGHLHEHPRVASMDSQAWGNAARDVAFKAGASCTMAVKERALREWYDAQTGRTLDTPPQLRLLW